MPRISGRTLRRIGLWTGVVVVCLALVLTGLVIWSVNRALPQLGGELNLRGLTARVTVYRDEYGIPQLYADNADDLFRAQGYVHAQDRFWEMDVRRHITSGRLSEMFGSDTIGEDAYLRTLGWRKVAEQEWDLVAPDTRRYLQDYADGVNAWLVDHDGGAASLEYSVLSLSNSDYQIAKWDPIDSLAWLKAMAWDLRGNMVDELDRALLLASGLTRDQVEQLYPAYPYARNQPIVTQGAIVKGGFDGSVKPPKTPAAGPAHGTDAALREVAPILQSLSAGLESLPLGRAGVGIGSNAWALSGALTSTGKPLLANDPHLSPTMPGIWYQIGLHCTCEFNVEGFSFSGVPGVVIGHNARVAWGFTNLSPDVTDLYLERLQGDKAFDGTTWQPLTVRQEVIKVAGGAPVTINVRSTKHGPLLSDRDADLFTVAHRPGVDLAGSPLPAVSPAPTPSLDSESAGTPAAVRDSTIGVALRWTALDPGRTMDALFALDTATDWSDFRDAARLFEVPSQNMVYADVDGNIGYQAPGKVPVRGKGDGRWPAPGWDPSYDWKGYLPFEVLPNVLNPASGMVVTANQAVIGPQYPYFLTDDWDYGYRSQRIRDMIATRTDSGKITPEDLRQMQFDNRNAFAPTLVPALLQAPAVGEVARARDMLKNWNFQEPAAEPTDTSASAAFYNAVWMHLLKRTFDELPADVAPDGSARWYDVFRILLANPASPWWDDKRTSTVEHMNDILSAAMEDAYAELKDKFSPDPAEWRWGQLHTLTLTNQTLGKSGIGPIEWLFNRGPAPVSGGDSIVNATGWDASTGSYDTTAVPSMRMIVDLSNLDASRWVQLSGNSGHAYSPNYSDQFDLWRNGENFPMRWNRNTIESEAKNTLVLKP
jgi:penicillin amidase